MRICLNMIVRDESAILARCLRSVAPHVQHYVICDTGSTDDTVDVIRATLDGVTGEIHEIPFENFEQARNQALDLCRRSTAAFDYILLIDADMELVVEKPGWRDELSHGAYLVRQSSGGFAYHNIRLLARETRARYVGVTHEYLAVEADTHRLETVHMLDHACGSSRAVKLERDERLLRGALEQAPHDARTVFYLAQTLREAGRHHEAVAMYERRIAMGGWDEEVWYARWMIARCHEAMGDSARFAAACLEAYDARPSRAEPLHALADHYRHACRHDACVMLAETGLQIPMPTDLLFVDGDVYRHGFRHQISISGYFSQVPARREMARRFCAELAVDREASDHVRTLARANWRFYARGCAELFEGTRFVPIDVPRPAGYHACNPSLTVRGDEVWAVVRTVNYQLSNGVYQVEGDGVIRSQSWLARLDADLRPQGAVAIVEEDPPRVEDARIVGLEDIRVFTDGDRFRACCTVADRDADWRRRMAVFDLDDDGAVRRLTLQRHDAHEHQKNWMPFVDDRGVGFVYWTDPTIVLRWDADTRQARPWRRRECAAALEHQRGGSGLVRFDGGWLCVTHEVSWVDGHRTYLHRLLHLDAQLRVRSVTEPFWFRLNGIEFCSGLVAGPAAGVQADQLLLSFGVNDGEAWLAVLEAAEVRRRLQKVRRGREGR